MPEAGGALKHIQGDEKGRWPSGEGVGRGPYNSAILSRSASRTKDGMV
jgi:hypothetical protein